MKYLKFMSVLLLLSAFSWGCASMKVTRLDVDNKKSDLDLSGEWNDVDVRIVCESLVKDASGAPYVSRYANEKGRLPVVVVGSFRNETDEHMDTSIISKNMETALLNSGKMDFVATAEQKPEVRAEIRQQQEWTTPETRKALAQETGADFIMLGTVKIITDADNTQTVRRYYVYSELIDLQSGKKIWMGKNSQIKKLIRRSLVKP